MTTRPPDDELVQRQVDAAVALEKRLGVIQTALAESSTKLSSELSRLAEHIETSNTRIAKTEQLVASLAEEYRIHIVELELRKPYERMQALEAWREGVERGTLASKAVQVEIQRMRTRDIAVLAAIGGGAVTVLNLVIRIVETWL